MKQLPEDTKLISTYSEIRAHLYDFVEMSRTDNPVQLWVVGPPGTSKSTIVKESLRGIKHYFVSGSATSAKLYEELYYHRDEIIVFDDLESVYRDRALMSMLKNLSDTDPIKVVYRIKMRKPDDPIPDSFETRSPVLIITNGIEIKRTTALCHRFEILHFVPNPVEVLNEADRWFDDKEILDFVEALLPSLTKLDLRKLNAIKRNKRKGIRNWRVEAGSILGLPRNMVIMIDILAGGGYGSRMEQKKEFGRRTAPEKLDKTVISSWDNCWDRLPLGFKRMYEP